MVNSSDSSFNDMETLKKYKLMGVDRKLFMSDTPETYGGHRKAKIYGRMYCQSALRAIEKGGYVNNRVFFALMSKQRSQQDIDPGSLSS
jgi:hypothetical protein